MKNLWVKNKKIILIAVIALVLVGVLIVSVILITKNSSEGSDKPQETSQIQIADNVEVDLGDGLKILSVGNYTGLYFEDGTDDTVTNVLMLELYNSSDKDLQLARVGLEYTDFTADFEATNIPAGSSVVVLAKNRIPYTSEKYVSISTDNIVFFDSPMEKMEDTLVVGGGEGYVDVKNISDNTVSTTTYVYYKNYSKDKFYGGITYRAQITEPIEAGESVRVLTNHFSEKNTMVVQVQNAE